MRQANEQRRDHGTGHAAGFLVIKTVIYQPTSGDARQDVLNRARSVAKRGLFASLSRRMESLANENGSSHVTSIEERASSWIGRKDSVPNLDMANVVQHVRTNVKTVRLACHQPNCML